VKPLADWPRAQAKARIFKAMGHPTRLLIMEFLARAGVLRRHREGVRMIYELALPCLLKAMPCVTEALKGGRCR
jgi:hypothetical protein